MRTVCLTLALLGSSLAASGVDDVAGLRIETPHADRLPAIAPGDRLIVTHLYTLALDPQTRLARWCAYTVTAAGFETHNVLERNWRTIYPAEALESADYLGSGYQRGHLCPLASVAASPFASEANRMEAVVPQRGAMNAGVWLDLEQHTRTLAASGPVRCLAGPAYLQPQPPLPHADEPHRVPSHCWLVLHQVGRAGREAYLVPQDAPRDAKRSRYALPLAELVAVVPALQPLTEATP